ncbi:MAG: hypothetical protein JW830_11905 [Bacteroidales bacterium]|nr:hypothetical protein [Bacteroidales bacterium]
MKTLKIFSAVCFMIAITASTANCQKTTGEYEWIFGSNPQITACVGEEISGTITVAWSSNKFTYHEKGKGILTGATSGAEYEISFNFNKEFIWHHVVVFGYTFPMLLKREGKLVAIIHESYRGIALSENFFGGPYIVDRYVYDVECK